MPYVPVNPSSLGAFKLKRMLALSPTWIARVSQVDERAEDRIAQEEFPADTPDELFPRAIVSRGSSRWEMVSGGCAVSMRPGFLLELYVWLTPSDESWCEDDQRMEMWDCLEGILKDICSLSGADDADSVDGTSHLNIVEATFDVKGENDNKDRNANGLRVVGVMSFRVGDA